MCLLCEFQKIKTNKEMDALSIILITCINLIMYQIDVSQRHTQHLQVK